MKITIALVVLAALVCATTSRARAAELGSFEIKEPVGQTWTDEWLSRRVTIKPENPVRVGDLRLVQDGSPLPVQFAAADGKVLTPDALLSGPSELTVLFHATIRSSSIARFIVTTDAPAHQPPVIRVDREDGRARVNNGVYDLLFDSESLLPIDRIRPAGQRDALGAFSWPASARPTAVNDQWLEIGPARAILRREFKFGDPARKYAITLDMRAGDPWIDITDEYNLGRGSAITLDLRGLNADRVYHPYAYNARTFSPGGEEDDSTIQPPQHPVATLGPIWRDIWYNGGPFAFVYSSRSSHGIGFAAVRGSEWTSDPDVTPESQNLEIHGDRQQPGQITVRIPTDGTRRRWAIIVSPVEQRKQIGRMVRSHADIPLQKVLDEWILDWPSNAPIVKNGAAGTYLGSWFNRHFFNPTTYPRNVRNSLPKVGPVKSRDLAVLAYIFSDPNYWPGPGYRWKIGNPNFNTDMYTVYLRIGLLMPDHPHAKRWVERGMAELKTNLYRDSFPGGAWAESISYSSFFYDVARYGKMIKDAGIMDPFREWPRYREVATYLAAMHTPVDPRYGQRQKAPIGDTHPGNYVKETREMAEYFRGVDDRFAEQLARFPEKWDGALDLSSREFYGFGAMLRGSPYDDEHESFVTIKAGPARNHYQGDELSFYFASESTPLAIDYACHYSPRPWSAAMHNRPDMNGKRPVTLAARRAFATGPEADVFVADEWTTQISEVPMEPHRTTRPGWEYPTSQLPPDKAWKMRRWTMLVKHDPRKSRIPDYLVVRDEISSPEPIGWNLHILGREIQRTGQRFIFPGQLGVDLSAYFISPRIEQFEDRQWGWKDVDGGKLRTVKGEEYEKQFFGAWIPPDFQRGTWGQDRKGHPELSGEMAKWLRIVHPAGQSNWLVVLLPHKPGRLAATVERISATTVKVSIGTEIETITLGTEASPQALIERGGTRTILVKAGEVDQDIKAEQKPPAGLDQGAR